MEPFHQTQRQPILAASQVAPASFSLFNALHKVEPSKKVKVLRDLTPNVNKLWLVVKQIAGANPQNPLQPNSFRLLGNEKLKVGRIVFHVKEVNTAFQKFSGIQESLDTEYAGDDRCDTHPEDESNNLTHLQELQRNSFFVKSPFSHPLQPGWQERHKGQGKVNRMLQIESKSLKSNRLLNLDRKEIDSCPEIDSFDSENVFLSEEEFESPKLQRNQGDRNALRQSEGLKPSVKMLSKIS
jgi:hypothetical protein